MNRFDPSRIAIPALAILSLLLLGGAGLLIYQYHRTWQITIAAGGKTGESYILAQALKTVVEHRRPEVTIIVKETGGTAENLKLLETGQADLATAQSDVPAGPSARLVAILYSDAFQLLVRKDSSIKSFADLAAKRIALPTKGGQFQSFLNVAEHFGFSRSDFTFLPDDESGASFLKGDADALFRVRALGNPALTKLAREGRVRLVPIEQAAAMRIRTPSFEPGVVPQGAYLGNPAIPEQDTPTVLVSRTMLARFSAPAQPVRWITEVLIEDREEIAHAIPDAFAEVRPLLASIKRPEEHSGMGAGVHSGALAYYEKDKPSFVQSNADFVALIVSMVVLCGSWLWELKRWLERKQKNRADAYNHEIIALLTRTQETDTAEDLDQIRQELTKILIASVNDLDEDRISDESFQSIRVLWQIAVDAVKERASTVSMLAQ